MMTSPQPQCASNGAFALVGQFFYAFARMERAMDDGIGVLLGLDPWQTRVVCSAIPLAKKVEVLFATERQLAAKPDKGRAKQLSTVKKQVHDLNGIRVKLAHYICDFEKDTLIIRHVVNPNSFKISDLRFSVEEVQGFCRSEEHTSEL